MAKERVTNIEQLENIYFIYGDEELLAEEALTRLQKLLSSQVDADFNLEVLNACEVGYSGIVDSAEIIPLLSARRLVIVHDVDKLSRKDQESLASYIEKPNPATVLVLVSHFPKPGEIRDAGIIKKIESSALYKKASQVGEILKFSFGPREKETKLDNWVTAEFKKRGKKINQDAKSLLREKAGKELRDLEDVIERVSLFAEGKQDITRTEVEQVVFSVADQGIFELVDFVADRRRDLSLHSLNVLTRQGESPQRIFNLLLRQFRMIARVKALASEHGSQEIASQVGIPPFLVNKCLQQAKRFSSDRLRSLFLKFRKAQVELHSIKYLEEKDYQNSILEMLILRIIG